MLALLLVVFSVVLIVLPDSGNYSPDTTYVKTHVPAADNYYISIVSDDMEDGDEDGFVDFQISSGPLPRTVAFVSMDDNFASLGTPRLELPVDEVYLINRQFLI
jgi:hypothetical protein